MNPAKDWELVSTVRKELGDKLDLYYDANNGFSVATAIRLGRRFQDELNVLHFEEPLAQHDYAGYAEVCAALDMAVAAGEHEYTLWQFRDLIERAQVDVVQPDLVKAAGLTECVRIAHLAQAHGKVLVPHQTQQTIGHTANVHYLAAFDNSAHAQEYSWVPERAAKLWTLFKQDLSPKGGYATRARRPGARPRARRGCDEGARRGGLSDWRRYSFRNEYLHTSIATTSWARTDGTASSSQPADSRTGGVVPATSSRTPLALRPSGIRSRTRCSPTGSSSRTGPFIIIGFVRFTRCTVSESFWRQTVTSRTPGPATVTGGSSRVAQATALRISLKWSGASTSQNVRSMSQGK